MCCELSVTRYTRVVLMEIVSASTFVINIITPAQLPDCYLPPCLSLLIVIHHQLDQQHLHLLQIEYNQPTDRYLIIYYYTPQSHVISKRPHGILIFSEENNHNKQRPATLALTTVINVMASFIKPHIALYFSTLGRSVSPQVCKYQNMNSF